MNGPIQTVLVVEDILSEALLRRMLRHFPDKFQFCTALGKEGFGFIRKNMRAFNRAAETMLFVVMTDLDDHLCPELILRSWLPEPVHPNLIFRVAIREAEAWLLADRTGLAEYLNVSPEMIPRDSETVSDPKQLVIDLARDSESDEIRDAMVPGAGKRRKVGPDYNGCLLRFVFRHWRPEEARKRSDSLDRALRAIGRFRFQAPRKGESEPAGFGGRNFCERS